MSDRSKKLCKTRARVAHSFLAFGGVVWEDTHHTTSLIDSVVIRLTYPSQRWAVWTLVAPQRIAELLLPPSYILFSTLAALTSVRQLGICLFTETYIGAYRRREGGGGILVEGRTVMVLERDRWGPLRRRLSHRILQPVLTFALRRSDRLRELVPSCAGPGSKLAREGPRDRRRSLAEISVDRMVVRHRVYVPGQEQDVHVGEAA